MPRLSKRATLIREYESLAERWVKKAYVHFCFDNEDSSENDIDYCILAELAVWKSSQYRLRGLYRQWDSNWEWMLQDGM